MKCYIFYKIDGEEYDEEYRTIYDAEKRQKDLEAVNIKAILIKV